MWLVSSAALIGALVVAAPATAAPAPPASPVAQGRVTAAGGGPAAGVEVSLFAEPSQAVLSAMKVGDSYSPQLIATTRTAADGSYSLASDATRVNYRVVAVAADGGYAQWDVPARPTAASGTAKAFAAAADPAPLDLQLDARGAAPSGPGTGVAVAKATSISSTLLETTQPWDIIGQLYSTSTGVTSDFQYRSGQSSELGGGISISGAYGSFSASGSKSVTSTLTIDFPSQPSTSSYAKFFKSKWEYGKYRDIVTTCTTGCVTQTRYGVRAIRFLGGSSTVGTTAPAASYCIPYDTGSALTIDTGTAITWTNGVSLSYYVGLNLSSKTGFATNASMKYTFAATRKLCGVGDFPGGANTYQVVAKP